MPHALPPCKHRPVILGSMFPLVRIVVALVLALGIAGCSVISVDLTPRVRPLEEESVEGRGDAKMVIVELAGVFSDAESAPILSLGNPASRGPLLVRLREARESASDAS